MQFDFKETPETVIDEHKIQAFCPECGMVNSFDTAALDGFRIADFLREVSFTTSCSSCEAPIRLGLVEHEAFMMFASPPSQFKHGELRLIPAVGECLCGFCGSLFQNEGMYFAEGDTFAFIGPMCYECLVSHYEGLLDSGREGYIRILPYVHQYRTRPTLWGKRNGKSFVKVQCTHCLAVNPLPDDFKLPGYDLDMHATYHCPNCKSDSYMKYVITGSVLEVRLDD